MHTREWISFETPPPKTIASGSIIFIIKDKLKPRLSMNLFIKSLSSFESFLAFLNQFFLIVLVCHYKTLFQKFNNKFFPRDTKDQVKFLKKSINLKNIKKNDIIFWKGHVALALSKDKLIHAYGPLKKTVIMNIQKTITRIEKTANLKVLSIKQ